MALYEAHRGGSEGETPFPAGFGRPEDASGEPPLDGQHPSVEIAVAQHGEFASSGAGVRGQSHKDQALLGAEEQAPPSGRVRLRAQLPGPHENGTIRVHE